MTFLSNLKWNATTIIAAILIALGAVQTFLNANAGKPFDFFGCAIFVFSAIASFFIGTNPDGTKKTPTQVAQLNKQAATTAVK